MPSFLVMSLVSALAETRLAWEDRQIMITSVYTQVTIYTHRLLLVLHRYNLVNPASLEKSILKPDHSCLEMGIHSPSSPKMP